MIRKTKNFVTLALVSIITVGSLILQSCSEDIFEIDSRVTKEEVLDLANKYGIPIEFIEEVETSNLNTPSLEELDKIFASYKKSRDRNFEKSLKMNKDKDKLVFQTIRKERNIGVMRLKSKPVEGGMVNKESWYYDLTWLNVSVSWQDTGDERDVNISSNYNGVGFYNYEQNNSTYSTSGDTIFYEIHGTQSSTIGFDNFGIHFKDDVNASGWINTKTGEGTVNIDKSDYWF